MRAFSKVWDGERDGLFLVSLIKQALAPALHLPAWARRCSCRQPACNSFIRETAREREGGREAGREGERASDSQRQIAQQHTNKHVQTCSYLLYAHTETDTDIDKCITHTLSKKCIFCCRPQQRTTRGMHAASNCPQDALERLE